MAQIDLDDLPPKIAGAMAGLAEGEELIVVQHGAVVVRLTARDCAPNLAQAGPEDVSAEDQMADVLEQFNAMIHDEF